MVKGGQKVGTFRKRAGARRCPSGTREVSGDNPRVWGVGVGAEGASQKPLEKLRTRGSRQPSLALDFHLIWNANTAFSRSALPGRQPAGGAFDRKRPPGLSKIMLAAKFLCR
jgi:hypothetical protein